MLDASKYKVTSEKSKFGGHRAKIVHATQGHTMYLGAQGYSSPKHAEGEASEYLKAYASTGDQAASSAAQNYRKDNKLHHAIPRQQ